MSAAAIIDAQGRVAGWSEGARLLTGHTAQEVVAAGPPLGVGGLPFEATELELPEGSIIALYTGGLIEDRDRDFDRAAGELRRALGTPADSLEALSDNVLKAVMPEHPTDDVALLMVRTRALGGDRVATWDVPPDPARVAGFRQAATERLAAWGRFHLTAPAAGARLRRGRVRTAAGRPAHPALGQPADGQRQDHLAQQPLPDA